MNGKENLNGRIIKIAGNGNPNHQGFAGVGPDCVFDKVNQIYIPRTDVNGTGQKEPVVVKIDQRTTV